METKTKTKLVLVSHHVCLGSFASRVETFSINFTHLVLMRINFVDGPVSIDSKHMICQNGKKTKQAWSLDQIQMWSKQMILFFGLDQKKNTCDPILHIQSQMMTILDLSIHPFSLTIFGWENPEFISSAPNAKLARTFLFSLNSETQQGKGGQTVKQMQTWQ